MPYYGFNFLWMYVSDGEMPREPDERALDFLAQTGFNFVRVPTNYRSWIKDFDYLHPDESVFAYLDRYLDACRAAEPAPEPEPAPRARLLHQQQRPGAGQPVARSGRPGRVCLPVGDVRAALPRRPQCGPQLRPGERAAPCRAVRPDPRKPRRRDPPHGRGDPRD